MLHLFSESFPLRSMAKNQNNLSFSICKSFLVDHYTTSDDYFNKNNKILQKKIEIIYGYNFQLKYI